MLRSHHHHSHSSPYGVHRFHHMRPSVIRYPRSRMDYRHRMMYRPAFYPSPLPAKNDSYFDVLLAILAALFCLNRQQPQRRAINSGGFVGIPFGGGGYHGGAHLGTSGIGGHHGGGHHGGGHHGGGDIGGSSSCGSGGGGGDIGGSSSCGGGGTGGGSCGGGGGCGGGGCGGGGD